MTVMEYLNKFNHLAQYAGTHVDTNDNKMDRFNHGLSCILQEKLYTGGYQTFGALMNAAIAMEGLQYDSQAEWKRKSGALRRGRWIIQVKPDILLNQHGVRLCLIKRCPIHRWPSSLSDPNRLRSGQRARCLPQRGSTRATSKRMTRT